MESSLQKFPPMIPQVRCVSSVKLGLQYLLQKIYTNDNVRKIKNCNGSI